MANTPTHPVQMPLDESFPDEVVDTGQPQADATTADAAQVDAASTQVDSATADATTSADATQAVAVDTTTSADATAADDQTAAATAAPVFNEAEYLKQFGDDVESPAQLKERLDGYKSNQVTDEIKGQLAVLSDAAKLGEYAAIAGKDYDKPEAADVMRERFALEHPDMSPAQAERRFQAAFAQKYPTLYAALDPENGIEADDPRLLAEKEDADYDAKADRAFLKTNQENFKQKFFADAAAASTAPQQTPEQIADANAVLKWFDETMTKDNAALPLDLGNGLTFNLPIGDAKSFKDGFIDTDKVYRAAVTNEDGTINKEAQAEIALFLRDRKGYRAAIANAVKSAQPAAIAIDDLTNSSRRQAPAKAAPVAATGASNHPQYVAADDWQNSNA